MSIGRCSVGGGTAHSIKAKISKGGCWYMYNLRFAKAEQARKAITNQQLKQIREMYQEIADQYSRRIENLSDKTNISSILRTQYLR